MEQISSTRQSDTRRKTRTLVKLKTGWSSVTPSLSEGVYLIGLVIAGPSDAAAGNECGLRWWDLIRCAVLASLGVTGALLAARR
jgi:hypothetical protein